MISCGSEILLSRVAVARLSRSNKSSYLSLSADSNFNPQLFPHGRRDVGVHDDSTSLKTYHVPSADITAINSQRSPTNGVVIVMDTSEVTRGWSRCEPSPMKSTWRVRGRGRDWPIRFPDASSARGARVSSDPPRRIQSTFGNASLIRYPTTLPIGTRDTRMCE